MSQCWVFYTDHAILVNDGLEGMYAAVTCTAMSFLHPCHMPCHTHLRKISTSLEGHLQNSKFLVNNGSHLEFFIGCICRHCHKMHCIHSFWKTAKRCTVKEYQDTVQMITHTLLGAFFPTSWLTFHGLNLQQHKHGIEQQWPGAILNVCAGLKVTQCDFAAINNGNTVAKSTAVAVVSV